MLAATDWGSLAALVALFLLLGVAWFLPGYFMSRHSDRMEEIERERKRRRDEFR